MGLETAPHTHRMGPLAACLPGRSRGHRERGGGGRREPLTQAGGARALLTSGKPRPSRGRRLPGAPVPPPGARLTVLVSVLQAWPRLSPQGAGPPAGEGVAPALIPLWGGPCCHKAQSRPRFGRPGWGRGRPQSRLTQGLFRSRSTPCPPHWRGSGVNTSCRYWTSRLFGRPEGGGARGGSGRVVQSPPVLGAVPTGVDKATSHLGPRPTPGPRRGKAWARAEARPGSACSRAAFCAAAGPVRGQRTPLALPRGSWGHIGGQSALEAPTTARTEPRGETQPVPAGSGSGSPETLGSWESRCPQNTGHGRRLHSPPQTRATVDRAWLCCPQVLVWPSEGPRVSASPCHFTGEGTGVRGGGGGAGPGWWRSLAGAWRLLQQPRPGVPQPCPFPDLRSAGASRPPGVHRPGGHVVGSLGFEWQLPEHVPGGPCLAGVPRGPRRCSGEGDVAGAGLARRGVGVHPAGRTRAPRTPRGGVLRPSGPSPFWLVEDGPWRDRR